MFFPPGASLAAVAREEVWVVPVGCGATGQRVGIMNLFLPWRCCFPVATADRPPRNAPT